MAAMLGLLGVVFLGAAGLKDVAYGLAAGIILLELAQAMLARAALRRAPMVDRHAIYASRPLRRSEQHLGRLNLVISILAPLVLLTIPTTSFEHDRLTEFVLLIAACVPSSISQWRVQRNNSWLAVSRVPASSRRAIKQGS
jgi:hypothetical protein